VRGPRVDDAKLLVAESHREARALVEGVERRREPHREHPFALGAEEARRGLGLHRGAPLREEPLGEVRRVRLDAKRAMRPGPAARGSAASRAAPEVVIVAPWHPRSATSRSARSFIGAKSSTRRPRPSACAKRRLFLAFTR
jgi:hypothetical protein